MSWKIFLLFRTNTKLFFHVTPLFMLSKQVAGLCVCVCVFLEEQNNQIVLWSGAMVYWREHTLPSQTFWLNLSAAVSGRVNQKQKKGEGFVKELVKNDSVSDGFKDCLIQTGTSRDAGSNGRWKWLPAWAQMKRLKGASVRFTGCQIPALWLGDAWHHR